MLKIEKSKLECVSANGPVLWAVPIGSIVLVAEYTTDEGPHRDDYFLIFVTVEDGKLYFSSCSFYSGDVDETLRVLEKHLGTAIQLRLQGSTEWRSHVAWPVGMADCEYYTFRAVPAETLAERIKKKLFGPTQEYAVSKVVQDYLEQRLRGHFRG